MTCQLLDSYDNVLAEFLIDDQVEGWFYGQVVSRAAIPAELEQELAWYDQVVTNQMLSFLDDAQAKIDNRRLRIRFANQVGQAISSLHMNRVGEVTFRLLEVPEKNGVASL